MWWIHQVVLELCEQRQIMGGGWAVECEAKQHSFKLECILSHKAASMLPSLTETLFQDIYWSFPPINQLGERTDNFQVSYVYYFTLQE